MATYYISSPENSFIILNDGDEITVTDGVVVTPAAPAGPCDPSGRGDEIEYGCIHIHDVDDHAFQFIFTDSAEGDRDDLSIGLWLGCDCPESPVVGADFLQDWGIGPELTVNMIDTDNYVFSFSPDAIDLCTLVQNGDVVRWVLFNASSDEVLACSNCFQFNDVVDYSTVMRYKNPSNAFGFYYEEAGASFYNKIRMYMHMHSPIWPERSKVFTDSKGVTKKLYSRMLEEYVVDVDYLDERLHRCMAIALGHSTVQLYHEDEWKGKVFMEGDAYEPKWLNEPGHITRSGPVTFKFTTTPFNNQNNNC